MNLVNAWLKIAEQWLTYISYCAGQPVYTPVCRAFWTWAMVAALTIGGLTFLMVAWKIISYQLKLKAALRAEAARQFVDHDAIDKTRWVGESAYSEDVGGEEVERRIREVVEKQRLERAQVT